MKKELRKEVETSEKIWGYVAGKGEFENRGQEPLGLQKRAQKFLKILKKYRTSWTLDLKKILTRPRSRRMEGP